MLAEQAHYKNVLPRLSQIVHVAVAPAWVHIQMKAVEVHCDINKHTYKAQPSCFMLAKKDMKIGTNMEETRFSMLQQ